jgi:hypothetical protein
MTNTQNEILLTGYGRTPEGITANELYKIIVVALKVDKLSGDILDSEVSLVTELAKKFASDMLTGQNIMDINQIEQKFNDKFHGQARRAIVSSIRMCYDKFVQIK